MKVRLLCSTLLLLLMCAPLFANWPYIQDQDERREVYGKVVTAAIAESAKALEAGDLARARYPLLGIMDLAGEDPKVNAELAAAYEAACAKAWPEAPDEKAFHAVAKEYGPKLQEAYFNALYLAASCDSQSSTRVFEEIARGASMHPGAEALALEYCPKSLPPKALLMYSRQGKNSMEASNIIARIADIYGGPWAIARACKESVIPNALDQAVQEIGRIDLNDDDAQLMAFRAQMVENDRLKWIRLFDPENAQCKELQTKVDAIKQKARELRAAQIKENRMPPDSYSGADKADLKTAMANIFEKQPGATIVKVVIYGNWQEKPFVWTGLNNVDAGWYKLIDAAVLCKYADGTFHVHPVTYGRRWTGGDKYGDLEVRGWADQYEILPQYAK